MAMSNLLFYEWKRLFKERNFRYILLALFVLCVGSAILSSLNYSFEEAAWSTLPKDDNGNLLQNVSLATYTLYNSWIGGLPTGLAPIIFYTMLPLCASIPYATTIIDDRKSGYIRGFIAHYGRKRYYLCRYLMVFISGAVTILIPLVTNYIIAACFVPARLPDAVDNLYFQVYKDTILGGIYYLHPFLYDLLYLLIDAVFAGVWATVTMACSFYTSSKLVAIIGPYIALLYCSYAADLALMLRVSINVEPLELIRPISVGNAENGWVLCAEIVCMFLLALIVICIRGNKDDVF